MVVVAQLVRALDCGSRGRRFEPGLPPLKSLEFLQGFFFWPNVPLKKIVKQKAPLLRGFSIETTYVVLVLRIEWILV